MEYEAVIGLEVHAQLLSSSKIFCGCSTKFGEAPNLNTCPVCLGMPGSLPVLNKKVLEYAIKMALATNCRVNPYSVFARKNYFYPDLPKGYQISQYENPLAEGGYVEIEVDGEVKKIGLVRIHIEEDAGKLIHDPYQPVSYVDFNRTGVPLIEIVSEPDIKTPEEASLYLKKLRSILRYLEICDGNMEEGSFRCDANISIRPKGEKRLGTKTELKNMNSFRHVQKALSYEISRQKAIIESGGHIIQETRLWDESKNKTLPMRGKEEAHDYRYFPDPDLVPVYIEEGLVERLKKELPELPSVRKKRFIEEYDLPSYDAEILTGEKGLADYFEATLKGIYEPKMVSNWIMSELLRELNREKREIESCPVTPEGLAELLQMIKDKTISGKIAKTVFIEMYNTGKSAKEIVSEKGLVQVSDENAITELVEEVLKEHPKEVAQYKSGKEKLFGFFMGQIMKKSKGKANPKIANEILRKTLTKGE